MTRFSMIVNLRGNYQSPGWMKVVHAWDTIGSACIDPLLTLKCKHQVGDFQGVESQAH